MVRWSAIILLAIFFLFGGYTFKDIGQAIVYYGNSIFPSNPGIGIIIFLVLVVIIIFHDTFFGLFKESKTKIKFKKKF
jgi:hypothetical protein